MRKLLTLNLAVFLLSVSAVAWTAGRQARPASASMPPIDDVLQAVRADLQNDRGETIARNVTLTSEQGAKFWPMYQQYQKEQNAIMDEQLHGIQQFIENFDRLDDAGALALIHAHFTRDARMNTLRQRWLPEFQKALGTKTAVRVMQIDRRLSLAHQMQFSAKIPLAH